jgi:hypothetical protein
VRDDMVDCGPGDDDFDGDRAEAYGLDCEAVTPQMSGTLAYMGATFAGGTPLSLNPLDVRTTFNTAGKHPTHYELLRWFRCDGDGNGCVKTAEETLGDTFSLFRVLDPEDVGHRVYAEWVTGNRAGSTALKSDLTPVITPMQWLPGPSDGSYVDPAKYLDPFAKPPTLGTQLKTQLKSAGAKLAAGSLRQLAARRSLDVTFTAPVAGSYALALTLPAKAARKLGVRGNRAVTLASGAVTARTAGQAAKAKLKTTKTGRKLMKRARRMDVSLGVTLKQKGDDATLHVAATLTLKRR